MVCGMQCGAVRLLQRPQAYALGQRGARGAIGLAAHRHCGGMHISAAWRLLCANSAPHPTPASGGSHAMHCVQRRLQVPTPADLPAVHRHPPRPGHPHRVHRPRHPRRADWPRATPGTAPSGPTLDTATFMRGSLVHDALYQLMRDGHLDRATHREAADRLLQTLCEEDGMWSLRTWWVYHGVRLFADPAANPAASRPVVFAPAGCRAVRSRSAWPKDFQAPARTELRRISQLHPWLIHGPAVKSAPGFRVQPPRCLVAGDTPPRYLRSGSWLQTISRANSPYRRRPWVRRFPC